MHAPQLERKYKYCMWNYQWKIIGKQPPTTNPIELKDDSNDQAQWEWAMITKQKKKKTGTYLL